MRKVHQIKQTEVTPGRSRTCGTGQEATNLDFVALLSSVGEDILLPDELSCPEYEIRTEINKMNNSMEQSSIPGGHRSIEVISNSQSPMSTGHRTLDVVSQSTLPGNQRSFVGNSNSLLSVGIRSTERMTESPGNGGVKLNLQNISQSTVPESHSMEAINQSPGGQSRLKITDHSLVPDSSCDIDLENNQQVCC